MRTDDRRWGCTLAIAALGAAFGLAVRAQAFYPVHVTSDSMAPTIRAGDWMAVIDVPDAERATLQRGDLVIYRYPAGTEGRAVKRVVALAGDAVEVAGAQRPVGPCSDAGPCQTVPPGHVFIVGDNTAASLDSRTLGPLAAADVVGRVRFVIPRPW